MIRGSPEINSRPEQRIVRIHSRRVDFSTDSFRFGFWYLLRILGTNARDLHSLLGRSGLHSESIILCGTYFGSL